MFLHISMVQESTHTYVKWLFNYLNYNFSFSRSNCRCVLCLEVQVVVIAITWCSLWFHPEFRMDFLLSTWVILVLTVRSPRRRIRFHHVWTDFRWTDVRRTDVRWTDRVWTICQRTSRYWPIRRRTCTDWTILPIRLRISKIRPIHRWTYKGWRCLW